MREPSVVEKGYWVNLTKYSGPLVLHSAFHAPPHTAALSRVMTVIELSSCNSARAESGCRGESIVRRVESRRPTQCAKAGSGSGCSVRQGTMPKESRRWTGIMRGSMKMCLLSSWRCTCCAATRRRSGCALALDRAPPANANNATTPMIRLMAASARSFQSCRGLEPANHAVLPDPYLHRSARPAYAIPNPPAPAQRVPDFATGERGRRAITV